MLNKKEITRWIKALRSGRYQQGKRRLTIVNGNKKKLNHCCLGVLCSIKGTPFTIVDDKMPSGKAIKARAYLFTDPLPIYYDNRSMVPVAWIPDPSMLARMNDEEGKSFNEIADYIEANILPEASDE